MDFGRYNLSQPIIWVQVLYAQAFSRILCAGFSILLYSIVLAFSLNKSFALFGYVPPMCASQG